MGLGEVHVGAGLGGDMPQPSSLPQLIRGGRRYQVLEDHGEGKVHSHHQGIDGWVVHPAPDGDGVRRGGEPVQRVVDLYHRVQVSRDGEGRSFHANLGRVAEGPEGGLINAHDGVLGGVLGQNR